MRFSIKRVLLVTILAFLLALTAYNLVPPPQPLAKSEQSYTVAFSGYWIPEEKQSVLDAIYDIGLRFADVTNVSPTLIWNCTYGKVEFVSTAGLDDAWGQASKNIVVLVRGHVSDRLVVHELGHSFAYHFPEEISPMEELKNVGIYDASGNLVTGSIRGYYSRYAGKSAPWNGYYSDYWKDLWQLHPRNWEDGNNADEDFADIFLNWVYGSFTKTPSGDALRVWMDYQMERWLIVCDQPRMQYIIK